LIGTESTSHGGLTRELARTVLPVSNYTECYWKIDLHNFFHFCRLRMDDHAQQEIQDYAKVMFEMVKPEVPIATEAFEDYSLNSKSLSRMENDVLQYALKCFPDIKQFIKQLKDSEDIQFDMTSREWKELEEKIDK
jgi:thymidylate synthase (FAD)